MARNLTTKIFEDHLVEGAWGPGEPVAISVDQVLTHDALGGLLFLQFAALGIPRVKTEVAVAYADHNVLQVDPRMTHDHKLIRTAARKFGAHYSRPGTGICHEVHLERFAAPGKVLLGSDSHTPTAGGVGMIAVGAGGLDVTMAMAGSPWRLPAPAVVDVRLTGRLRPWVTAKDVILELLRRLSVKGGVGKVFEFSGPGVQTLSVPERATITNMCTELGATTGVFPSDEVTRDFLERAGRPHVWSDVQPDRDAPYDDVVDIDLSRVEPLIACPSMPDRVRPVAEVEGTKVDQVLLGSCTNGSYTDILQLARVLEGRRVHPEVDVVVNPSSKQSLELLARDGMLGPLMSSGVVLSEATCGPCIGLAHVPAEGSVSVRTFNRNFSGRSGLKPDRVYLASPLVAAVAALTGEIRDPIAWGKREGVAAPPSEGPARFDFPEGDIVPPAPEDEAAAIELPVDARAGALPDMEPLPDDVTVEVVGVFGDDVTTDDISPASPEALASMTNLEEMSGFTFDALDQGFVERARAASAGAIVAGNNYGQGSSRENAALAPRHLGVRVVLARSFARIHRANLINWGIVPLVLCEGEPELGDSLRFSGFKRWLIEQGAAPRRGRSPTFEVVTSKGQRVVMQHDLGDRELLVVLSGGLLPFSSGKDGR